MIVAVPDQRRCIVVGAGLFGLSSAWALSGRGWRVLVLEAADTVGHDWSGSKGGARIFRLGYPEAHYVDLARRAGDLWRALQARTGRTLLHPTGQATVGDGAPLHAVADALAAAGVPAEWLTESEARTRFPGITATGPVLYEAASGVLAADECLRALLESADFELRTGARVLEVHEHDAGVHVATAGRRSEEADCVVLCAGPHSLGLLGGTHGVTAAPSVPQVAYFRPARPGGLDGLPVFIEWGADMVYGLPVPDGHDHGGTFKVSHHTPGAVLSAPEGSPGGLAPPGDPTVMPPDDKALLAVLTDAVGRLVPALDPQPVATERCLYDNSADTDFVLDRVGRVVVGCGSSGHGFKFGPLIGEILADLADGASPVVDLTPFRLIR